MLTVDVNSHALPGQPAAAGDSIQDREVKYQLARHVWRFIRRVASDSTCGRGAAWPDEEDDEQEGARVTRGFSSLLAALQRPIQQPCTDHI